MLVRSSWLVILAIGCTKTEESSVPPTDTNPPTEPTVPDPYEATYGGGQYNVSAFSSYTLDDEGFDQDADGTPDNATPNALLLVDPFVKQDMSVDGLNVTVAEALAKDLMILLGEAGYASDVLTVDVLTGQLDKSGLAPDPVSYAGDGTPLGRVEGYFTATDEIWATADRIQVAITFFADEPPLPLPIENVTMIGTLDAATLDADVYGVIPADDLTALLIVPLLEDAYPDEEERQTYLDLVNEVLQYDTVTDIDLGDGRRGVSCAFHLTAEAVTW